MMPDNSLEAKICVLGAQGVGKTSLVERFVKGTFSPPTTQSTVGASFETKRAVDDDSGTTVRLQIWDTAGQERFHSISRLYYRTASAVILTYSIIDERSFNEMGRWLDEVRQQLGDDIIIHVVGTKSDLVAEDPNRRAIPFERCIAYVAERLHPSLAATPPPTAGGTPGQGAGAAIDKRHSGFWVQDVGWDDCHEVSASSGEGIDEVFRVVTRKLVEKRQRAMPDATQPASQSAGGDASAGTASRYATRAGGDAARGYLDRPSTMDSNRSKPGMSDKRRSWLGFPSAAPTPGGDDSGLVDIADASQGNRGRCC